MTCDLQSAFLGFKPNRRYGQHFMIDDHLLNKLVRYISPTKHDAILEVGSGNGTLTSLLAEQAGKVIAIEKDPRLVKLLKERFGTQSAIEIIEGDVLKAKLPIFNKVVSNLPYCISSKFMLFLTKRTFELAVLTLQKEFAQKLVARNKTSEYGRIGVLVQHRMNVNMLDLVPRQAFYPRPKVTSVIVALSPKHDLHRVVDEILFDELVRGLFTQRRKKVERALAYYIRSKIGMPDQNVVRESNPPNSRVYEMAVEEFEELSNRVSLSLKERS